MVNFNYLRYRLYRLGIYKGKRNLCVLMLLKGAA
jgi:hypothetical protein